MKQYSKGNKLYIKQTLKHLNECYFIFEKECNRKGISEDNKKDYIQLLLKSYINSSKILDIKKDNL